MSAHGFTIRDARGAAEVAACRELFLEYQQALGVSLCFQGFDQELAALPGAYVAPRGRLLLAFGPACPVGPVGCVALRPAEGADGEMKRLYVRDAARGTGLGRALARRIIDEARAIGYQRVVLDTLPSMAAAQALYAALGFRDIPRYNDNPVDGVRFMGLELTRAP